LLQFRQAGRAHQQRQQLINDFNSSAVVITPAAGPDQLDLTSSYLRLANLPTCPLDRLSRYEAALWRQAGQILFTLGP
jgi:hypothetical protein